MESIDIATYANEFASPHCTHKCSAGSFVGINKQSSQSKKIILSLTTIFNKQQYDNTRIKDYFFYNDITFQF
jgi:hypothetical protein